MRIFESAIAMTSSISLNRSVQPKPLLITVGLHLLLLLILLLWRFSLPEQAPSLPEMGMEVNLGSSADGSGADQPMDIEDPAAASAVTIRSQAAAASAADVERSNDDDAPSVAHASASHATRPVNTTTPAATQRPGAATTTAATTAAAQPQRPRYVYPGSSGKGGNSASVNTPGTGEGNTTGPGDRGVPGGTPGSPNYSGSPGSGTGGISHSLGGRSIVAFPPKEAQFREGGRVVVRITVDRDGAIVNKQIVSSTNTELSPIALRKLLQVRFNKSETAPEEQFGNITFVFKTRH